MLEVDVKQRRMTTYSKRCGFHEIAGEESEYSENSMLVVGFLGFAQQQQQQKSIQRAVKFLT